MKWLKKDQTQAIEGGKSQSWLKIVGGVLAVLVIFSVVVMIVNYRFPKFFEPETENKVPGEIFTETLVTVSDEMMSNWLPNDMIWPTIFMDNVPNYQLGELEVVRYSVRVLRDKLSRLRTTDKIDPDAEAAFTFFSNDPYKWILPSAESKFKKGIASLIQYENRLKAGQAHFYPRSDNLNELLDQYISLLGGVTTRLSNAPNRKKTVLSSETEGDEFSKGEKRVAVDIPWSELDNNFYYAQGVAYVLRQMLVAIKYEFSSILDIKKAGELVDLIIEILDKSQFEPLVVLNGSRGSIWANHSLQLQSLLEDARQKMGSLQDMLKN